jgi:methionyl-tRNA formyltransferase
MTSKDKFRVVFLSGSAYSSMATDIMALLQGQGPYEFYAVVNRVTAGRLRQAGLGAILRKGVSVLRNRWQTRWARAAASAAHHSQPPSAPTPVRVLSVPRIGDATSIEALRTICPNVCVNTGGCGILRRNFLASAGLGVLNCHSGLPHFRGFNVFEWQLYYGRGLTLFAHLIDTGIDTGPIVAKLPLTLIPNPTLDAVRQAYTSQMAQVLAEGVNLLYRQGTSCLLPQRLEDGRQYFAMHHRLRRLLDMRLAREGEHAKVIDLRDHAWLVDFDQTTVAPDIGVF